jgi:hypothetical protein
MRKILLSTFAATTQFVVVPAQAIVCQFPYPIECAVITGSMAVHYCDNTTNTNVTAADYYWRSPSGSLRPVGSTALNCNNDDVPSSCKTKPDPKVCNGKPGN